MTRNLPTEICQLKSTIYYEIIIGTRYALESETKYRIESENLGGYDRKILLETGTGYWTFSILILFKITGTENFRLL